VLVLVIVALTSTTVSASIGVVSLELGDATGDDLGSVWRLWWLGDVGGALLVAPFLLVAVSHWPFRELPGRAPEGVLLATGLAVTGWMAFESTHPIGYVVFPFLIWAAVRFWQPGATGAALLTATLAVIITADGQGQFVDPSEDDSLLLAQTFSAVAGLTALFLGVISRARAQAERTSRELAHDLQSELLPRRLAEIPGVETAAWYDAGAEGQEVGGDFYDLFRSGEREWVAVIGDVCGRGPEAAALTALARHTLRAVFEQPIAPSAALAKLNRAILEHGADGRFITAVCARVTFDGSGYEATISSGGHPYPLLVNRRGEVREIETPGVLLGVVGDPDLADARVWLEPGSALVLFTDGLIEDPGWENPYAAEWLREALARCASRHADEIVASLEREILTFETEARDDRALLVVTVPGGDGSLVEEAG
jgi:Stage II sporulation protein E (SpoIIE)/MASE1